MRDRPRRRALPRSLLSLQITPRLPMPPAAPRTATLNPALAPNPVMWAASFANRLSAIVLSKVFFSLFSTPSKSRAEVSVSAWAQRAKAWEGGRREGEREEEKHCNPPVLADEGKWVQEARGVRSRVAACPVDWPAGGNGTEQASSPVSPSRDFSESRSPRKLDTDGRASLRFFPKLDHKKERGGRRESRFRVLGAGVLTEKIFRHLRRDRSPDSLSRRPKWTVKPRQSATEQLQASAKWGNVCAVTLPSSIDRAEVVER